VGFPAKLDLGFGSLLGLEGQIMSWFGAGSPTFDSRASDFRSKHSGA
jgi:hypothetical protein